MAIKEHPVIFSTEMIKAILDGRKTQTRRVTNPQSVFKHYWVNRKYMSKNAVESVELKDGSSAQPGSPDHLKECPYGQPGDRLWVRETWCEYEPDDIQGTKIYYKANIKSEYGLPEWRSPIFMPRWASRITLEITDVRVERLQEISPSDVTAEGIIEEEGDGLILLDKFEDLWNFIHKKQYRWEENCWVWVISFGRVK